MALLRIFPPFWVWIALPVSGKPMTYPLNRILLAGSETTTYPQIPNSTVYTIFDEVTTYPYEVDTLISWQQVNSSTQDELWNSSESLSTGQPGSEDWELVSSTAGGTSTFQQVVLGVALYALSFLTLAGNTMVLHAIRTERRLQTVSNMFIMSLAVADLTVGLIVMPISSAYALANEWQMGDFICLFWLSADYTASTASILNLFILSLDRYWSITSPLRYMRKRTKKRALVMIAFVWLVSAMWIIPIVFWEDWDPDTVDELPASSAESKFSKNCDTKFSDNVLFKLTASTLNFYIPMVLMIVLYFKIFMEVKKRSKFAIGENQICYATQAVCSSPGRSISRKALAKDVDFVSEDNESISAHEEPNKVGGTPSTSSGSNNHKHLVVASAATATSTRPDKGKRRKPEEDGLSSENPPDWEDEGSGNSPESNKSTVVVSNTCTPCLMHVRNDAPVERKRNPPAGQGSTSTSAVIMPNSNGNSSFYFSKKKRKRDGNSFRESYELEKVPRGGSNASTPVENASTGNSMKRQRPPFRLRVTRNNYAANLGQQKKAARQLGVIIGAFVACWLPYIVVFITTAICPACISSSLHTTVIWLGYLNSTINPFLYALCNANFKIAFKKMFCHHNPHAFMLGHRSVDNKVDNNMFA
ncbi:histamine H1 receptor [Galendromus occidentalis]|uniref:Histamine H1 receptor n=1 Tax=Galendromus occidentalis TaxID=34638 RepID=A0AAJ7L7G1_9ACAR|nr:histamine H1 receptor [Galendromus occidentalis]